MTKLRTVLICLALLCLFLLSGCSSTVISGVGSLLVPPDPGGENGAIMAAFKSVADGEYVLKAPQSGDYQSAFVVTDINGDGASEALVFYSQVPSLGRNARINLVARGNSEWLSVYDAYGESPQPESVNFADMDSDGVKEILIGWSDPENVTASHLCVYRYSERGLSRIFDMPYSSFQVIDLDGDGKKDILLASPYEGGKENGCRARFVYMDKNGSLSFKGEIGLDERTRSIERIIADKPKDGSTPGAYLDCTTGDGRLLTQRIQWVKGKFLNTHPELAQQTLRSIQVFSKDSDEDGAVEVPTEKKIPGSYVVYGDRPQRDSGISLVIWTENSGKGRKEFDRGIYMKEDEYILHVPADWEDKITGVNDRDNRTLRVLPSEEDGATNTSRSLFTIKTVRLGDEKSFDSYYGRLKKTDKYFYMYKIFAEGERCGITKELLEGLLSPLNGNN